MKVTFILVCTSFLLTIRTTHGKAVQAPLHLISLDDLTPEDRKQLEILNKEASRHKRSGSDDVWSSIGAAIAKNVKKKISQFAKSSASASAKFSGGLSSGSSASHDEHYEHHHHHHVPESYDHKSFDWWSLKKSILNTLLQAVKAIKGGVIAIKGQLLKGSGYLISAKGKLLAQKGDSVTELGKKIASSAILSPHPSHTGPSGHEEHNHDYGPTAGHYGPPPHLEYGIPSSSGSGYLPSASQASNAYSPPKYTSTYEDSAAHGAQAGIVILKKIPKQQHRGTLKGAASSSVPDFKPLKPPTESDYSMPGVIGKFLSASSSLQPDHPNTVPQATYASQTEEQPDEDAQVSADEQVVQPEENEKSRPVEYTNPLLNQKPSTFSEPEEQQQPTDSEPESKPVYPSDYQNQFKLHLQFPKRPEKNSKTPVKPEDLPSIESFPPYPGPLPMEFITKYGLQSQGFNLQSFPISSDLTAQDLEMLDPRFNAHSINTKLLNSEPVQSKPPRIIRTQGPPPIFTRQPSGGLPPDTRIPPKHRHQTRQVPKAKSPRRPHDIVKSVTYQIGPDGPVRLID